MSRTELNPLGGELANPIRIKPVSAAAVSAVADPRMFVFGESQFNYSSEVVVGNTLFIAYRTNSGTYKVCIWAYDLNTKTTLFHKEFADASYNLLDPWCGADASGNFYLAFQHGSGPYGYIIKISSAGAIVWQKNLNTVSTSPKSLRVMSDGTLYFVAIGGTIVKMASDGSIIWQKTLNNFGGVVRRLAVASDGSVFVLTSGSTTSCDVIKLDSNGAVAWGKQIGDAVYNTRNVNDITVLSDGTIFAVGSVNDTSNDYGYCFRLNADGSLFDAHVGGVAHNIMRHCVGLSDGKVAFSGYAKMLSLGQTSPGNAVTKGVFSLPAQGASFRVSYIAIANQTADAGVFEFGNRFISDEKHLIVTRRNTTAGVAIALDDVRSNMRAGVFASVGLSQVRNIDVKADNYGRMNSNVTLTTTLATSANASLSPVAGALAPSNIASPTITDITRIE